MSLGDTIRRALTDRGWSIGELARRTGVHQSTLSRILSGETASPGAYVLRRITEELNLPAAALLGRSSEAHTELIADVARVPLVRIPAHAGADWTWQDSGERITVDRALARGRDLFAVTVVGDCMQPDLNPGDVVVYDQWSRTPEDGQMVVVTVSGQSQVRWARWQGRELQLVDNSGVVLPLTEAILEGVVVEIRRPRPRRRSWHDMTE